MRCLSLSRQLLVSAVADSQAVLSDLQQCITAQGHEVALFAQQQREVCRLQSYVLSIIFVIRILPRTVLQHYKYSLINRDPSSIFR